MWFQPRPRSRARIEALIREVLCRERDPAKIAHDVREMRAMIAKEKGEGDRWDLKYAAGGLVDIEFAAQFLMLVHAAKHLTIVDTNTVRVLDEARSLNLIDAADGELLRAAAKLYHDLTQLLRLCLSGRFDPKTAGPGCWRCWRAPAGCRISPRSRRISPTPRRGYAASSSGLSASS